MPKTVFLYSKVIPKLNPIARVRIPIMFHCVDFCNCLPTCAIVRTNINGHIVSLNKYCCLPELHIYTLDKVGTVPKMHILSAH